MRAAVQRYLSGELTSQALPASQPGPELTSHAQPASQVRGQVTSQAITATGPGEPSPGVLCMGPGCWERNTSRYGLRRLPLCPACAAALGGETYQRKASPGAAQILQRVTGT